MKLVIVLVCAIGMASCYDQHRDGYYNKKHLMQKLHLSATKDLGTIVGELGSCVNQEAITNWVIEKMTSDEDFQKVVEYLKGEHFKIIDEHVWKNQWVNNHLAYLEDNGVKVYESLNAVREILGLPPLQRPMANVHYNLPANIAPPDIEWDLLHLFIELWHLTKGSIVCVLETLYKYHKDPALLDLLTQFEDPAFKEFLEYVWAKQEVKELFDLIQKGNLDLEYIISVIQRLLGLGCSKNTPLDLLYKLDPPKSHKPVPLRLAQMYAKYQKYNKV
jgi:hypothetical protein